MKKLIFIVLTLLLLLSACMPSQEQIDGIISSAQETAMAQVTFVAPTTNVDDIVQATFQALTAQAVTPLPPAGANGGVAGRVNQGADYVGAFDVNSNAVYKLTLANNATSYQIDNIPPGTYYVIAFHDGGNFAAPFPQAYSNYVTCGMTDACTDHTPISVTVTAGQITQGVDAVDNWGNAELNPFVNRFYGFDNTGATDNIPTFTPVGGLSGSIAGTLSYPSEFIPAQAIVAFHVGGAPTDYYFTVTQDGQSTYQLDNLPPGQYQVVAYLVGGALSAGYSQAVPCGLSVNCSDHSLIVVNVNGGQVTGNVNPQDWYAPDGTFPAYPLP